MEKNNEVKVDERLVRLAKLEKMQKDGVKTYPARFDRTHTAKQVIELSETKKLRESEAVFAEPKKEIRVAGRIMTFREHGKIAFANIQDVSGQVQICFKFEVLGEKTFSFLFNDVDLGDFIGVVGEPFITKQGKLAVLCAELVFLGKALRPLPDKFHGVEDVEIKYRKRYLDLITDRETFDRFLIRSKITQSIRNWLLKKDFVEVVTRTLQPQAGGAMAEPFTTHHNALDTDFSLRIAPELDLKMAVVGGMERVFEFAINFRNEGMDPSHVQEFQMLEWYCAYENFETGIDWTEEMLRFSINEALGNLIFNVFDKEGNSHQIDFSKPIPRIKFSDLLKEHAGIDMIETSTEDLIKKAVELGIDKKEAEGRSRGNLLDDIYKKTTRPKLVQPVFVTHYPVEIVPLARPTDDDPKIAESYQLVIASWEIVKAYSELVDPIVQRQKFEEQAKAKAGGDKEAMELNEEFLTAMEHGMPPITGWGMGIERFVTLITGQRNLRDVVLFPLMKPEDGKDE